MPYNVTITLPDGVVIRQTTDNTNGISFSRGGIVNVIPDITQFLGTTRLGLQSETGSYSATIQVAAIVQPPTPTLIDGFNSLSGYTVTGGTQALDTAKKVQGTGMIVIQGNGSSGNNPFIVRTNDTTPYTAANLGTIAFFVRHFEESERQPFQIALKLGRSGTYYDTIPNRPGFGAQRPSGGFWVCGHVSEAASLYALAGNLQLDRQVNIVQNTLANYNSFSSKVGVDALMMNAAGRPTFLFAFDDNEDTALDAAAYMAQYGIPGTLYLPAAQLGLNSTKLSEAEVNTLYFNYLWDVANNGTQDDTAMTEHATLADAIADINANRAFLVSKGWLRAKDDFCYPGPHTGSPVTSPTDISPDPVTLPLATTSLSTPNTVSFASSVAAFNLMGYDLQIVGLPGAYTTITGVAGDGLSVTVSNPVALAVSAKAAIAVDRRGEFFMGKLQAALLAEGYRSGRLAYPLIGNQNTMYTRYGLGDAAMWLSAKFLSGASTFANMKPFIDEALLRGTTLIIGVHRISATDPGSGSIQVWDPVFRAVVDYIGAAKSNGLADCATISQFMTSMATASAQLP